MTAADPVSRTRMSLSSSILWLPGGNACVCKPAAVLLSNTHVTTASVQEDVSSVRDPFSLPDVVNVNRALARLLTMEDQQQGF